jgi:ribosomal protein L29
MKNNTTDTDAMQETLASLVGSEIENTALNAVLTGSTEKKEMAEKLLSEARSQFMERFSTLSPTDPNFTKGRILQKQIADAATILKNG